jgi:phage terminase large subunit-like protein
MGKYVDTALEYARQVVAGEIPACKWTMLACKRQLDDLARPVGKDWNFVFDVQRAERPCEFIEMLPHIKGKWARDKRLIELEGWQCFVITTVFGWVRWAESGYDDVPGRWLRRFREGYTEVPRKNAKSTLSSGLALYMLTADGEQGAEVYSAATTRDQARIVFDDAKAMADRLPGLRTYLGLAILQHALTVANTSSSFRPLAAEGSTLDGLNVHFAVIDELHAHKTRAVYDVIDTARGAREQSLLWNITTAGSDRSGICYERRTHVTKVLDNLIDDSSLFGIIYSIDDGDDPHDPESWAKANPNWLKSVLPDDMESASRKGAAMPSAMGNFLTKRLNVWINGDSAWMDMPAWNRCANPQLSVDDLVQLPCVIGLDLASKVDVAAKVRIWYDEARGMYYLKPVFYLPERAVEQSGNSQYDGWRRAGYLKVTDGEVVDFDNIEDDLRDDLRSLQVREIAYDPWQATQLASHLLAEGAPMVEMRQTVQNISEPMKTLEALVLQGKLEHDGNPMMTWMISNVVCHRDAKDNIYPRKERNENKIDGPVGAIMALGRLVSSEDQGMVYDGSLTVV